MADIDDFEDIMATPGFAGFDTETTVERQYNRELCTVQAAHSDGREAVVWLYNQPALIKRAMAAIDRSPCTLVAHNAVFDFGMCRKYGATPRDMVCTYIAARVLRGRVDSDMNALRWGLKDVAARELGMALDKSVRGRDWREPLDAEAYAYALEDSLAARDLWALYSHEFEQNQLVYQGFRIINDAVPAIAACNNNGLLFDRENHAALCARLAEDCEAADFELDLLCGGAIENHSSPKQVGQWVAEQLTFEEGCTPKRASMLFAQLTGENWPVTTVGFSMDKKVVERLLPTVAAGWPHLADYLVARAKRQKSTKLLEAFGPTLAEKVDADGRIRTSLFLHGARTSRQTSVSPNLQNQPAEEEFRAMYKADRKNRRKLVIADYSQIELRVGCIICHDLQMQKVFREGVDIHSATAAAIHNIVYDDSNPQHKKWRKGGKPVTFAALYGAQASTIALNSGLPYAEAVELLDKWLTVYSGVRNHRDTYPDEAHEKGYVELVSGQQIKVLDTSRPAQLINCLSDDTEILTPDGWKTVDDVKYGDSAMSVCPVTGLVEVCPIEAVTIRQIENERMLEMNGQAISAIATPEHRWLVDRRRRKGARFVTSEKLSRHGDDKIWLCGVGMHDEATIWSDDEVMLMGWVLTDGYYPKQVNPKTGDPYQCRNVMVSQRKPYHIDELDALFARLKAVEPRVQDGCKYWTVTTPATARMRRMMPDRVLTGAVIMSMSARQRRLLWGTMLKGDGHWCKDTHRYRRMTTATKDRTDAFLMLCATIGVSARAHCREATENSRVYDSIGYKIKSEPCWVVDLVQHARAQPQYGSEWIEWSGRVWCPTLKHGTWIAKRNGKVFVTGNCPVQGSAASVMYLALTYVHDALELSGIDAFLALNVHDEIIIDSHEDCAVEAAQLLQSEMARALGDLFPEAADMGLANVADAAICDHWGQKDLAEFKLTNIMKAAT